jgi:MFS family permease
MRKLAYGLFADRAAADAALAELERRGRPRDILRVDEYVGDMPNQDLPGPATRTRTYALIGGAIAAVLGALLGSLMFEAPLGTHPLAFAVFIGLGAGLLGALVSGLAGAAIPRRRLEALKPELAAGKVLVTVVAQTGNRSQDLARELRELGAVRAGTL